jgi:hypothetical protein
VTNKNRGPKEHSPDTQSDAPTVVLEGDGREAGDFWIDGSADMLEGIVDDEELAGLRRYALERAHERTKAAAAATTPAQPRKGSSGRKRRET